MAEKSKKWVCVFCGSADGERSEYRATTRELGRRIAERGHGQDERDARVGFARQERYGTRPAPGRYCIQIAPVISNEYSSLLLKSEPEFHAEWLRDGPCDATTTGSSNLRHRCQLSLTLSGGVHEIRGAGCIASR